MLPAIKRSTQKHQRPRLVMAEFPLTPGIVGLTTKRHAPRRKRVDLFLVLERSSASTKRRLVNVHTLADPDFNRLIRRLSLEQLFDYCTPLRHHRAARNQTEGNLFALPWA